VSNFAPGMFSELILDMIKLRVLNIKKNAFPFTSR
jgi:hypothetical protein